MQPRLPNDMSLKVRRLDKQGLSNFKKEDLQSILDRIKDMLDSPSVQSKTYIVQILKENKTVISERLAELEQMPAPMEHEEKKQPALEDASDVFKEALGLASLVRKHSERVSSSLESLASQGQKERVPDPAAVSKLNEQLSWGYFVLLNSVESRLRDPELSARVKVLLETVRPLIFSADFAGASKHKQELRELFLKIHSSSPELFS